TYYTYDSMKRQTASTRLGIMTANVLDAAGRVLQTIRTGTYNSQILMSQSQYDRAGRLISETNALGGVTSYTESTNSSGALVRTTTFPDGGTSTNYQFLDGTLKQIAGTAVRPMQYRYGWDSDGPYTTEIKVASDGSTNEWVKTSTDLVGRAWK